MARRKTKPETNGPVRVPQQERGQRRVHAILDAAAALIAEEGLEKLTIHGIAERAHTSIGSMYHFFPDLESVVAALMEQHYAALRALNEQIVARKADMWSELTTEEAVEAFLAPFLTYSDKHPDVFALLRGGAHELEESVIRSGAVALVEGVLTARQSQGSRAQRRLEATAMMGIVTGLASVLGPPRHSRMAFRREVRRALVSYLSSLEADPAS